MSKLLKIITEPNPILRKKSIDVNIDDLKSGKFKELFADMFFTMKKNNGVGLAAPQIGQNIRIIVINIEKQNFAMANPVITKRSWARETQEEGCLSVPKTFGKVRRHKKINCVFFNKNGIKKKIQVKELFARVIQHEIDHLNGILFIDSAHDLKKE